MKDKYKKILLVLLASVAVLVIIPLVINILFKVNSGIWLLQSEWLAGDALGFYGSVLSGIVTVLGVWITIRHEKAKGEQDDSIKYKPILELCGVDLKVVCGYREVGIGYSTSFDNDMPNRQALEKKFLESQFENAPKYRLFFKNVGRGETSNAEIENYKIRSLNWEDASYMHSVFSTPQYIGDVLKDGYLGVYVYLPDYLVLPKTMMDIIGLR